MGDDVRQVIIIGSGPAGFTAAVYAARANLEPLVIEGPIMGGQLAITTDVENYPGFPEGVQGPELMELFKKQAQRFGTKCISGSVSSVDFKQRPFAVTVDAEQTYHAQCVIIGTGATAQFLGLENEERLLGHGVSACATCDGFFFRDREVVVVGGGDSAMEEALFLTKFASKVTVVHRRDSLRASKIMQQRGLDHPKIDFIWDTVVEDVHDPEKEEVTAVTLKNIKTEESSEFPCQGLFLAIGHQPNTSFLEGAIELDPKGYVVVNDITRTSVDGVLACGDVQDVRYRQAVTAAGSGCMAAIDAEKWLEEQH